VQNIDEGFVRILTNVVCLVDRLTLIDICFYASISNHHHFILLLNQHEVDAVIDLEVIE
jgi:hypothetical protein